MSSSETGAQTLASLAGSRDVARVLRLVSALCQQLSSQIADGKARLLHPSQVALLTSATGEDTLGEIQSLALSGAEAAKDPGVDLAAAYAAPEVFAGKPSAVPSTVYHVAALTYHLLTGQAPFVGSSAAAIRIKVLLEKPPSPRSVRPELSTQLEQVLLQALDKKPEARPSSLADLASQLTQAEQASGPVSAADPMAMAGAPPMAASRAAAPPTRQGKSAIAALLLLVVVLLLGGSALMLLRTSDEAAAPAAPLARSAPAPAAPGALAPDAPAPGAPAQPQSRVAPAEPKEAEKKERRSPDRDDEAAPTAAKPRNEPAKSKRVAVSLPRPSGGHGAGAPPPPGAAPSAPAPPPSRPSAMQGGVPPGAGMALPASESSVPAEPPSVPSQGGAGKRGAVATKQKKKKSAPSPKKDSKQAPSPTDPLRGLSEPPVPAPSAQPAPQVEPASPVPVLSPPPQSKGRNKAVLGMVLLGIALLAAIGASLLLWVIRRDRLLALQRAKTQRTSSEADTVPTSKAEEPRSSRGAIDPFTVGQYTCFERLGEGGMGMVYKARHTNLDREAAVKVLSPSAMVAPDAIELFQREARLASQINHPNSVFIYDYGNVSDALFYLVMEFIDGQSLDEIISPKGKPPRPLPIPRVITLTRQVCAVLDVAHAQGIVHRGLVRLPS